MRRRGKSRLDVAYARCSEAQTATLRDETLDVQSDTRRLDLVSGPQQRGAFRRRLQRLRNDERDRLVGVAHAVVLQRLHTEREEALLGFRVAASGGRLAGVITSTTCGCALAASTSRCVTRPRAIVLTATPHTACLRDGCPRRSARPVTLRIASRRVSGWPTFEP